MILWTTALQAPLSMGFSRQERWSGLPCPPPGDFPDLGIEPTSPEAPELQVDFFFFFLLSHQGSPETLPILNFFHKKNTPKYTLELYTNVMKILWGQKL